MLLPAATATVERQRQLCQARLTHATPAGLYDAAASVLTGSACSLVDRFGRNHVHVCTKSVMSILCSMVAGRTRIRVLELRRLLHHGQGRLSSPWLLHSLSGRTARSSQRFVSNGATSGTGSNGATSGTGSNGATSGTGSNGATSATTSEECQKMVKELDSTAKRLRHHMKLLDSILLMMFGVTAGALVAVTAQTIRNKDENAKRDVQLTKAQEDLNKGTDLLNRTQTAMTELKKLTFLENTTEASSTADSAIPGEHH